MDADTILASIQRAKTKANVLTAAKLGLEMA
jgi:hypothetical protein